MQARDAAENIGSAVRRVIVQEWTAPGELVLEVRKFAAARAGIDIVLPPDGQRDAISRGYHDRRRPDLYIDLGNLVLAERLQPVMGVVGPVRCRELPIELSVGGPQPALRHRGVRI